MNKEEIIAMAREAGLSWPSGINGAGYRISNSIDLERFAALVAAHEREECAKVCESHINTPGQFLPFLCATDIRARGQV